MGGKGDRSVEFGKLGVICCIPKKNGYTTIGSTYQRSIADGSCRTELSSIF